MNYSSFYGILNHYGNNRLKEAINENTLEEEDITEDIDEIEEDDNDRTSEILSGLRQRDDIMIIDELESDDFIFFACLTPQAAHYVVSSDFLGFDKIQATEGNVYPWSDGNYDGIGNYNGKYIFGDFSKYNFKPFHDIVFKWCLHLRSACSENSYYWTTVYGIRRDYPLHKDDKNHYGGMFIKLTYWKYQGGKPNVELRFGTNCHHHLSLNDSWSEDAIIEKYGPNSGIENFRGMLANKIAKRIVSEIEKRADGIVLFLREKFNDPADLALSVKWLNRVTKGRFEDI